MQPGKYYKLWLIYFCLMIALIGGTAGYFIGAPLCLLGNLFPPARKGGHWVWQRCIQFLMAVEPWLNADIELNLPSPALSVSNHRSHLDAFLLLSRVRGVRMLCKHSLFYVPFLSLMMRVLRQIPVHRKNISSYWQAMETIRLGLQAHDAIHVFPEMTRCEPGFQGTQEFQLAPFHVAFQEKIPVVPIGFWGTDRAWPKGKTGLAFRQPVVVRSLEPLDPNQFESAAALAQEARLRIEAFLLAQGQTA
jgi:1-acyl-sn-glycerol-3-phosphate acyltransferase